MLRKKPINVLQKTYDDSYLSCSTAVYYESQGDELEAIRYWRKAIGQIHESRVTSSGSDRVSRTDTEKALLGAIKELELQCKERIDLLEALRVSRQEPHVKTSDEKRAPRPTLDASKSADKGSIAQGTIPTIAWSDLSRPPLPSRPSLPLRVSSDNPVATGRSGGVAAESPASSSSPSRLWAESSRLPSQDDQQNRSSSPEKHTMRTTLRPGRATEKSSRSARKSPATVAEGPSKAATLAWSALGPRDRLRKVYSTESGPSNSVSHLQEPSDQLSRPGVFQPHWDSHSRRLVTPRDSESSRHIIPSPSGRRHHEDQGCSKPSLLSVTAASSALNSSSSQELASSDRLSNREVGSSSSRGTILAPQSSKTSTHSYLSGTKATDDSAESQEKSRAAMPARRPVPARRPAAPMTQSTSVARDRETLNRAQHEQLPKAQQVSVSIIPEEDSLKVGDGLRLAQPRELVVKSDPDPAPSTEPVKEDGSSLSPSTTANTSILKNLPPGIDEAAAKQILNYIIVHGDEVHWEDVAGLEIAKNALRETVVYPFLRPDLFMGLREPARGMLLFGPPGTGKTMLARAVATESKSTFFSISASSLTSKYLGESEKLVKALFGLARALAPSIIFVDEIDSLLSQRSGSGEHEATRRIKTEFLIQWSDLQRAAAGRDVTDRDKERGDANRVLVLAATNLPWAIDEAARRRFVRRQYIPLPEPRTRETQLRTLLGQQKHSLASNDIRRLVDFTEGFSGSDITALAKDAAMGPLRSLGEALLRMTMDEIRPIMLQDFESSLGTIRPSVSKAGLKEYEDWAKEFGERGG